MKTLPEILRDVKLLLDDGRAHVVIARGDHEPLDARSAAFQLRLRRYDDMLPSEYHCEAHSWLGAQWSIWREQVSWLGAASFDIRDVLATDWRILS